MHYDFNYDSFGLTLKSENFPEVPEGAMIPDVEEQEIPETYREKYDQLRNAIKSHYTGGPMPEVFAEHTKDLG